jgi:hypothetical protein
MTEPIARTADHRFTPWKYDKHRRRWYRHCVIGTGSCTAVESVARGMKPKKGSK